METSLYERVGGESGVRAIVDGFYDRMDTWAGARNVRALHDASLRGSRQKLFMFLSGWLGGPQLYVEAFGHPRLRARHLPFRIDATSAEEWVACMRHALEAHVEDLELRSTIDGALTRLAHHMRNVD